MDPQSVVEGCRAYGEFRYCRNERNLAQNGNYRKVSTELATGEFIWLLGDDDTLKAGAVARVVEAIEQHGNDVDLFVLNFDHVVEDQRPPLEGVVGGIAGLDAPLARTKARGGLQRFEDLLDGEGEAFTAMYTLVIRQRLWVEFFARHRIGRLYASARWTYPNSVILAETMVHRQTYYIAEPMLTLFEMPLERFLWAHSAPVILTVRFAELLRSYRRQGVPSCSLEPYYAQTMCRVRSFLPVLLWGETRGGGYNTLVRLLWLMPGYRKEICRCFRDACLSDSASAWIHTAVDYLMRLKLGLWRMRRQRRV